MIYTEDLLKNLKNVAVIGNGQLEHRFGKLIDTYDNVIRINEFEIKGYESYCGTKITHWCVHGGFIDEKAVVSKFQNVSVFTSWKRQDFINFRKNKKLKPMSNIITSNDKIIDDNYSQIKKRHAPTTGYQLLAILENLKIKTDVYGFDFLTTGHYWNKNHVHYINHHSGFLEKKAVEKMKYINLVSCIPSNIKTYKVL